MNASHCSRRRRVWRGGATDDAEDVDAEDVDAFDAFAPRRSRPEAPSDDEASRRLRRGASEVVEGFERAAALAANRSGDAGRPSAAPSGSPSGSVDVPATADPRDGDSSRAMPSLAGGIFSGSSLASAKGSSTRRSRSVSRTARGGSAASSSSGTGTGAAASSGNGADSPGPARKRRTRSRCASLAADAAARSVRMRPTTRRKRDPVLVSIIIVSVVSASRSASAVPSFASPPRVSTGGAFLRVSSGSSATS